MSGATYAKYKTWADNEDVTATDLNAHVDNERNNLTPSGVDDYSASVAQMKIQTSPGAQGTESLATSTAGELERLRYALARLMGTTYWYDAPSMTLAEAYSAVTLGGVIPRNRIVSGRTLTTSDQAAFLQPHGTNATVTLKSTATAFVAQIDGTSYTSNADVALTSLALAPSTNNTALVNDAHLTGQTDSKYAGEIDSAFPTLTMDTVGTEISNLVGKFAAFKIGTEYFFAFVKSATELTRCYRGFFFNSSDSGVTRVTVSDNDTITLMKLHWIFFKTDGTLISTTSNPNVAADAPSSPSVGDYWYDLTNATWKTYNGASFVAANAILIGLAITDTSGCKGARSFEIFKVYSALNTVRLEYTTTNEIRSTVPGARISVNGTEYNFAKDPQEWDMAGDLESGSEASSTIYYAYVTEDGDTILSVERPYNRNADMLGRYHPYNTWRAVGQITNDGSSNFDATTLITYEERESSGVATLSAAGGISPFHAITRVDATSAAFNAFVPSAVELAGRTLFVRKIDTTLNAVTLIPYGSQTIDGSATTKLHTYGESLELYSDGSNWQIKQRIVPSWEFSFNAATTQGLGTITSETTFGRRIGNAIQVTARFVTGTVTASEARYGLPSGLTIANYVSTTHLAPVGVTGTGVYRGLLATTGQTYFTFSDTSAAPLTNIGGSTLAGNGQVVSFQGTVTVAEWNV
jgi:hypothetical protein